MFARSSCCIEWGKALKKKGRKEGGKEYKRGEEYEGRNTAGMGRRVRGSGRAMRIGVGWNS